MRRALAFVALIAAGCDVGSVLGAAPDGGGGSGSGAGSNGCIASGTPPTAHVHIAGGTSNAGQACIALGCHLAGNTGTGANAFTFAGTVYSTTGGGPVAGANVVVNLGTSKVTTVSDPDGNFYGTGPVTFPATTLVTSCPSLRSMIGQLATGGGNCNNCHRPGGPTTPITAQ